jgi:pyridoxal phosphate enzyme (YggS family)
VRGRYCPLVPTDTSLIAERIAAVRARVADAATAAGRDPADVRLLLATKTLPDDVVRAAVLAGGVLIGENRVQELLAHAAAVADLRPEVHLIGHLQSNKVAALLGRADVACVESVDSLGIAERLSRRCADLGRDLDVMVQVNVSGEATKSGVAPDEAPALAAEVAALPRLRLVGFMTIGLNSPDAAAVRAGYARLREVRDAVVGDLPDARHLSMGMSRDLELAVAEGATIVRVGTAVFGPRPPAR